MTTLLSNLVNNFAEEVHTMKCKFLLIIFLEKVHKTNVNVNTDTMIKIVKITRLNTKPVTAFGNEL